MTLSFLYWVLFIITVVLGLWGYWPVAPGPAGWRPLSGPILILILLFLLGWRVFGFVVSGV